MKIRSSLAAASIFLAALPVSAQTLTSAGPMQITPVAEGLDEPWGLAFLPDGRMLVTERPGRMRIVTPQGAVGEPITEAGLHWKKPFIQEVRRFDKRLLAWDGDVSQIPTLGREFVIVDTETTGTDPKMADLVEIAAVKVKGGKITEERFFYGS